MCIVEQKTYLEANGNPRLIERIRRCEKAVGPGTCSNTRQTFDTVRIVEAKPESSSSSRKDEVVTDNNGRTRTYRDLGRRLSQKNKTSHSKRPEKRDSPDLYRPVPSPTLEPRKASPVLRPHTPNSAPPTMSSFARDGSSDPGVRFRQNGTAVYDAPPSLLNIPRAPMNERLNTRPAERKVSFEDDTPRRHPYGLFSNTEARDSAMPSPTMSLPGLSRLPSIRHNRNDSARDLHFRDFVKPEREDGEYAARELARENSRRQKAETESDRRRQEDFEHRQRDLEAAENRQLDLEAERARKRLLVDPPVQQPHRLPESPFSHRNSFVDDEPASWSRHTSPSAPPRVPRPTPATRFASASPLPTSARSSRTYGRTVVHQYHYPDSPPVVVSNSNSNTSSRRPSDSIRERGREVIERERTRAAAAELQRAVEQRPSSDVGAGPRRWEPVFDEFEERVSGREYYYVSEGPARQESRRRHGSWREEMKRDFWS